MKKNIKKLIPLAITVLLLGVTLLSIHATEPKDEKKPEPFIQGHGPFIGRANVPNQVRLAPGRVGIIHRIYLISAAIIDGQSSIDWIRVAMRPLARSEHTPEKWVATVYDGPPAGIVGGVGLPIQVVCPKRPPPCEGCGWQLENSFTIYAWGMKEGTFLYSYSTLENWDEPYPIEGEYLVDPVGYEDRSRITLSPTEVQAGDRITVTVTVPRREVPHVSEVSLLFPEPKYPLSPVQTGLYNKRRVVFQNPPPNNRAVRSLPASYGNVEVIQTGGFNSQYTYVWTVPNEYYTADHFIHGRTSAVLFEVWSNRPDRNGRFPLIDRGDAYFYIWSDLKLKMGLQGKWIDLGSTGEWVENREKYVYASAIGGKGPFEYTWNIGGQTYTTQAGNFPSLAAGLRRDSRFTNADVLNQNTSFTVTITDAIGETATGTIYVNSTGPVAQPVKAMWIEPSEATVNKDQGVGFKTFARLMDDREIDISNEVEWNPSKYFKSSQSGTFTISATTERYQGNIQSASVTVRPKKRIALRILPDNRRLFVGQSASFDIVEVFEDNSQEIVGNKEFSATETGTFTIMGSYKDQDTINRAVIYVYELERMWIVPEESIVNKNEAVRFRVYAKYNVMNQDITEEAQISPTNNFSSPEAGEFTINAMAEDYPGDIESARVIVRELDRLSLLIEPSSATIGQGDETMFDVVEFFADNTRKVVKTERFVGREIGEFPVFSFYQNQMTENQATVVVESTPSPTPEDEEPEIDDIDEALLDMLKDEGTEDLCTRENIDEVFSDLDDLMASTMVNYSRFMMYANKFDKEVDDRRTDICQNGIVGYCYKEAIEVARILDNDVPQARELRDKIILMNEVCQGFTDELQRRGTSINTIISNTSGMGTYKQRLEHMQRRLQENGCDENELIQLGDSIVAPPGSDPDFLQDGGIMREIPGDGVDNTGDGFQDNVVQALSGYNITFVLYDSGPLKDDSFDLSVSSYGSLGTTPTGGLRSYGLNLSPGSYVATVTVVLSPDNIGTFALFVLENGEQIAKISGSPGMGGRVDLPFTVSDNK